MGPETVRAVSALVGLWLVGLSGTALATTKGSPVHQLAGRLFVGSAVLVALVLTPLARAERAWLVSDAAAITGYLAFAAWRVAARLASPTRSVLPDALAVLVLVGLGLHDLWLAWDAWTTAGDVPFVPAMGALAFAVLFLAGSEALRLLRPVPGASEALVHHVGMALGACTLAATATGALLGPVLALPDWLVWLTPAAIAVPSGLWWIQRVRAAGRKATFF